MSYIFTHRSSQPERMDLETLDAATTAVVYSQLEHINRWLGGWRATLQHLERFSRKWPAGKTIRMIDWGTGGADLPRAIVRWARRKGFKAEITGIDNNVAALAYARQTCRDYPEIRLRQNDLLNLAFLQEPYDYAITSLCLHHLPDEAIVHLLRQSDRFTRCGLIFNDLMRSSRAWAWIWALLKVFRAHPIVQNDGPLSVRRAFTPSDLVLLARQAGLSYLTVSTHFGYRLVLAGEKG